MVGFMMVGGVLKSGYVLLKKNGCCVYFLFNSSVSIVFLFIADLPFFQCLGSETLQQVPRFL